MIRGNSWDCLSVHLNVVRAEPTVCAEGTQSLNSCETLLREKFNRKQRGEFVGPGVAKTTGNIVRYCEGFAVNEWVGG